MAQEVKDSTIATGQDIDELLVNVGSAKQEGWIAAGPIVLHGQYLTQTLVKFGKYYSL